MENVRVEKNSQYGFVHLGGNSRKGQREGFEKSTMTQIVL